MLILFLSYFVRYITISNWGGNEPNRGTEENCLAIAKSYNWKWFDYICNSPREYICEMSLNTN